jgi:acid phosphatase
MPIPHRSVIYLFAVLSSLLATPGFSGRQRAARPPLTIGAVHRVFVVVLENEDAGAALAQPFLASLAARGALLRNYHALTHPSQPNYIALMAGDAYGIRDDNPVTIDVPHLGDLLDAKGISWKVYVEDYPGGCFAGASSKDSDPGFYVRRHVPFIEFANVQNDPARCAAHIVPASQFDTDSQNQALPRFSFYVPDTIHDGHDTTVADADAWLRNTFESKLSDPDFMNGLLFVVVFDEGTLSGPNQVYCSLTGAGIVPGTISDSWYDHYSLLRTIEEIFHTGTLHRQDEGAPVIMDIWSR